MWNEGQAKGVFFGDVENRCNLMAVVLQTNLTLALFDTHCVKKSLPLRAKRDAACKEKRRTLPSRLKLLLYDNMAGEQSARRYTLEIWKLNTQEKTLARPIC